MSKSDKKTDKRRLLPHPPKHASKQTFRSSDFVFDPSKAEPTPLDFIQRRMQELSTSPDGADD